MPSHLKKSAASAANSASGAMTIAEAKAHFSSMITRVEKKRTPITIFRRGVAVAQVVPLSDTPISLFGSMRGTVQELGDIVGPTGIEWNLKEDNE